MDIGELRAALSKHLSSQSYQTLAKAGDLDLALVIGGERWGFALCSDREEGMAYLGSFEAAMQRLLDARRAQPDLKLGLGIAFASTAAGQHPSYRRTLKKYSNSIVFEDLGISLFLIKSEDDILVLAPGEVNSFLRDLDIWIAKRAAQI
ncbi:MAG: hypothetical protein WEA61_08050 [Anaerolineales bacterium]